jgi:hypothetical protein
MGTYDTKIAFYDGSNCVGPILDCNDDACNFLRSELTAPVTAGNAYKLRVGGYSTNGQGSGTLTLTCEGTCPPAEFVSTIPPSDVVDARQPFPPTGTPAQGVGSAGEPIMIQMPPTVTGAQGCFSFCETATGGLPPNNIASVTDEGGGLYSIVLMRPVTPGAVSTISYLGGANFMAIFSHPSNINGDTIAAPNDILRIIDMLNGVASAPYGIYSQDIDHSGVFTPADILRTIDLLNGAQAYSVWNSTARPNNVSCP